MTKDTREAIARAIKFALSAYTSDNSKLMDCDLDDAATDILADLKREGFTISHLTALESAPQAGGDFEKRLLAYVSDLETDLEDAEGSILEWRKGHNAGVRHTVGAVAAFLKEHSRTALGGGWRPLTGQAIERLGDTGQPFFASITVTNRQTGATHVETPYLYLAERETEEGAIYYEAAVVGTGDETGWDIDDYEYYMPFDLPPPPQLEGET